MDCDQNVVVYHRWDESGGRILARYYVVLNFSQETRQVRFRVPDGGPWADLLGGDNLAANDSWGQATVGSNWGAIYWKQYA